SFPCKRHHRYRQRPLSPLGDLDGQHRAGIGGNERTCQQHQCPAQILHDHDSGLKTIRTSRKWSNSPLSAGGTGSGAALYTAFSTERSSIGSPQLRTMETSTTSPPGMILTRTVHSSPG